MILLIHLCVPQPGAELEPFREGDLGDFVATGTTKILPAFFVVSVACQPFRFFSFFQVWWPANI